MLKIIPSVQCLSLENIEYLPLMSAQTFFHIAISLKHLGGKLAPKLVYFGLEKELLNFIEKLARISAIFTTKQSNLTLKFMQLSQNYHLQQAVSWVIS